MAKKNKYVNIGIMCLRKKEKENDPDEFYIKLDKDVKIKIDGDDVTGGYLSVSDPLIKYDRMVAKAERDLEAGDIDEEKFDEIVENADNQAKRYEEDGDLSYIMHELSYVRRD